MDAGMQEDSELAELRVQGSRRLDCSTVEGALISRLHCRYCNLQAAEGAIVGPSCCRQIFEKDGCQWRAEIKG
jgi:hypothetical protein